MGAGHSRQGPNHRRHRWPSRSRFAHFGKNVERFHKDKTFLGIRQSQLTPALEKPAFVSNRKLRADAGLSVDAIPANRDDAAMVLVRITDLVPSLRMVIDHYPNAKLPDDRAAREAYLVSLKELGKRSQVYIKLSEVVKKVSDKVSADLITYKDWLDQLWDIFSENRVLFGSDWPQSENLELNSYPNVMTVARAYVTGKGRAAMEKVLEEFHSGVPLDQAEFDAAAGLSVMRFSVLDNRDPLVLARSDPPLIHDLEQDKSGSAPLPNLAKAASIHEALRSCASKSGVKLLLPFVRGQATRHLCIYGFLTRSRK